MAGAKDLHDSSPAAVRARRAYFEKKGRASTRDTSRRTSPLAGVARASASGAARFARNPVRYAGRESAVGAALFTFILIVALASIRRGRWPSQEEFATLAVAAVVIVALAVVLPEVTQGILIAAVVVALLLNAQLFADLITRGTSRLNTVLA